jgi:hypothetical protein
MTQLTYLEVAIAAGVQAAGLGVHDWSTRDRNIAEIAAQEAVRALVRLTGGMET